jgi:hypothetical protein
MGFADGCWVGDEEEDEGVGEGGNAGCDRHSEAPLVAVPTKRAPESHATTIAASASAASAISDSELVRTARTSTVTAPIRRSVPMPARPRAPVTIRSKTTATGASSFRASGVDPRGN